MIKDLFRGITAKRSSHWPAFRAKYLKAYPTCAACGGTKKLEAHHIKPFHLFPALELDWANLITLCESGRLGMNCHLALGHRGDFKKFNGSVAVMSHDWLSYLTR